MTLAQTTLGGVRKVLMNCVSFHLLHVACLISSS